MKVLFAVNNENVSEEIVKKYQKDYKEIISYKNVYYFNAIIKEMQRDKTYDRIVIGEDLEPFANNNYDTIDKFLFEKLDSISDEATDNGEKDAQIILICSDRRTKSDNLLVKLFGIGVYSAIVGKDRSVEEVCRLINTPRTKKEAKQYYRIDSDDVDYKTENDSDVNENEIQSILKHYKSLGKNEDRYIDSFNNIASQYTDAQLRVIIKFLPLNVKAVLEAECPKYQQVVMFGDKQYKKKNTANVIKKVEPNKEQVKRKANSIKENDLKIDSIEKRVNNPLTGKPIIIPSAIKSEKPFHVEETSDYKESVSKTVQSSEDIEARLQDLLQEQPKKGRGRPKKNIEDNVENIEKKGRGRQKKIVEESINLFDLAEEDAKLDNEDKLTDNEYAEEMSKEPVLLPGVEDETANTDISEIQDQNVQERDDLRNEKNYALEEEYKNYHNNCTYERNNQIEEKKATYNVYGQNSLITGDKKIIAFVGTTKNGTSFIVNNLAMLLCSMGINTAVLDATENKNAYYIFTKNEEELRKIAYTSLKKLNQGVSDGIKVNKNLTVYTSLPDEKEENDNPQIVLKTLANYHEVVLIDCDFNTNREYFESAQEIYLVQSMDVLTIQPLTAFMRNLKNAGVLKPEKLKIVVNKYTKIRGLSEKVLIGGMAFYNSPSMSFMTELFNKDNIKYCMIPLDQSAYTAYLEALVSCEISLNHYSKAFIQSLKELAQMVYPLVNKQGYKQKDSKKNYNQVYTGGHFSEDMNTTLEQMNRIKNGY